MSARNLFRLALIMLCISTAHADVIISDPKQLKNLTVTEVSGQNGAKYYQLTMVYTLADGSIGNADVSCGDSRASCQKLKNEISAAVSKGKSVLINFDNQKTVAQILDTPKPNDPSPTGRVVCTDSDINIIASLKTGFTINLKNDMPIPSNASTVQLNESCTAKLREAWGQPRNLKARSLSAFLAPSPYYFENNSYYKCPDGTEDRKDGSSNPCWKNGWVYKQPGSGAEHFTIETPLDRTISSIECKHNINSAPEAFKTMMDPWNTLLKNGNISDTSIGKAEACTKPVDAFLFGKHSPSDDAIAALMKSDAEGGVKNAGAPKSNGGSTSNESSINITL